MIYGRHPSPYPLPHPLGPQNMKLHFGPGDGVPRVLYMVVRALLWCKLAKQASPPPSYPSLLPIPSNMQCRRVNY